MRVPCTDPEIYFTRYSLKFFVAYVFLIAQVTYARNRFTYFVLSHNELAHNVKSTEGPSAGGLPAPESNRLTPPAIAYPVSLKSNLLMLKTLHPHL